MTDFASYPHPDRPVIPDAPKPPLLSLGVILGAMGAVSMVVVNRWKDIEPILESPTMIVLAMLTNFFAGCGAFYWLVSRPGDERFKRAEDLIRRMRDRENAMMARISELEVAKARLEERLSAVEARVPAAAPTPRARKPRVQKD